MLLCHTQNTQLFFLYKYCRMYYYYKLIWKFYLYTYSNYYIFKMKVMNCMRNKTTDEKLKGFVVFIISY